MKTLTLFFLEGLIASPGSQVDVAVTGAVQKADPSRIGDIDVKKRNCVTAHEIKLKYFEEYTGVMPR